MKVTGFAAYDPKAANFQATFTKIKATNPDAVFIGGLIDENSGQLINDKVAVLGPNTDARGRHAHPSGRLHDGRDLPAHEGGTPNAKGAYFSVAGVGIDKYKGAALDFINGFKASSAARPSTRTRSSARRPHGPARRDRQVRRQPSSVIDEVFKTKITDGLIGSFSLNENGDLTGANGAAMLFTIYKGTNKLNTLQTTSRRRIVDAAREGSGRLKRSLDPATRRRASALPPSLESANRGLTQHREVLRLSRTAPSADHILGFVFSASCLWLLHNLDQDSRTSSTVVLIGLTQGIGLRARRARLHARLRHPPADQLRARRRVRPQRPVREHVSSSPSSGSTSLGGPRRSSPACSVTFLIVVAFGATAQLHDRVRGLSPPASGSAARGADHRGRHVVHRPEHLARDLRRELPQRPAADLRGERLHDRRVHYQWIRSSWCW